MSSIPSFSGLNTALRGVVAQQRALDVTGHNIANVDTVGYSRQEAVLGAAPTLDLGSGAIQGGGGAQIGQGVDVLQYRRLRDDFLDLQWRSQAMAGGEADTQTQRLSQVESLVTDTSENGLGQLLSTFYSAWSDLSTNPESPAAQTAVMSAAQNLAAGFNSLSSSMTEVSAQASQAVGDLLGPSGPIAPIAEEINTLNLAINRSLLAGQQPNDLQDRRDQLLDQLSRYGQVSISTPDASRPGWVQVSFAGAATPLVDSSATPPVTVPTAATISSTPGGVLQGLQKTVAQISGPASPNYLASLDALASSIVAAVNGAHTSTPIFSGATAGSMAVAVATPSQIMAGSTGAAGANDVALAIAGGRTASTTSWSTLITQIGTNVATAKANAAAGARVLDSLSAQRASTQGVSIDEEMTNMIRFQRGYQAAARALTAMDENLDVLINRTGRVGL